MKTKEIKLNLGCGRKLLPGYINCDIAESIKADKYFNLERFPYPFDDNSVDEILMDNVLEHLTDVIATMKELHRILKPKGIVEIYVPYGKSDWALQDPTHKHFFTERSMDYFTDESGCNFYCPARFKILNKDLVSGRSSLKNRLRDVLPFRRILRYFFWNMYDGVYFKLEKM